MLERLKEVPSKQDCKLMYGALCKMKMWDPSFKQQDGKEKKPLLKILRY